MSTITDDIVRDLLPLVHAGEASADTVQLPESRGDGWTGTRSIVSSGWSGEAKGCSPLAGQLCWPGEGGAITCSELVLPVS